MGGAILYTLNLRAKQCFAGRVLFAARVKSRIVSYYWLCNFFNNVVFILLCSRCKVVGFTRETMSLMIRQFGGIVASRLPRRHVFICSLCCYSCANTVHVCTVLLRVGTQNHRNIRFHKRQGCFWPTPAACCSSVGAIGFVGFISLQFFKHTHFSCVISNDGAVNGAGTSSRTVASSGV